MMPFPCTDKTCPSHSHIRMTLKFKNKRGLPRPTRCGMLTVPYTKYVTVGTMWCTQKRVDTAAVAESLTRGACREAHSVKCIQSTRWILRVREWCSIVYGLVVHGQSGCCTRCGRKDEGNSREGELLSRPARSVVDGRTEGDGAVTRASEGSGGVTHVVIRKILNTSY